MFLKCSPIDQHVPAMCWGMVGMGGLGLDTAAIYSGRFRPCATQARLTSEGLQDAFAEMIYLPRMMAYMAFLPA